MSLIDEDNMATDSATRPPSQQSVKAYVDAQSYPANLGNAASGTALTVTSSSGTNTDLPAATTSAWGVMTDDDKTKLDGIETAATADQTNAEIRAAVEAATDSNVFTDADHTKLNAIEASATADQTDAEIKTAYENNSNTNAYTDAEKTKLSGIATSANNYTHPNHTGEVTSTADGATVIVDDTVDEANLKISNAGSNGQFLSKQSGNTGGLTWSTPTDTTYTAGTGISISGTTISASAVALTTVQSANSQSAHLALTAQEGDVVVRTDENKSYVHNGGSAGSMADYTLLATPTDAVLSVNGNTGAITAAQIAGAVEAASDSNTFTDADHTKLNGIEASATGDQTNAEIRAAVEAASDSNVFTDADHSKLNAIEASATADQTKSDIDALNINADTVDSLHAASFVRSDTSDTLGGNTYTFNSSADQKIVLDGTNPYINFYEGGSNKAYLQWHSSGYIYLSNDEQSRQLRMGGTSAPEYYNGSSWNGLWHAGNDGAGAGLDADTLDGVQGSSFLRSDADDTTTGHITFNYSGDHKFRLTGSNNPYFYFAEGTTNKAYIQWNSDGNLYCWNEEANTGLRIGSNLAFYHASAYREILHQNNVGSGGALSSSSVYINDVYCGSWLRLSATDTGLYHSGNNNYFYSDSNGQWALAYNGSGGGITIRDGHAGTIRGYLYADDSNYIGLLDNGGSWIFRGDSSLQTTFFGNVLIGSNNTYDLGTSGTRFKNGYFGTSVYDSKGELRNIPHNPTTSTTSSSYTLVASDAGKCIIAGSTVVIPNSVLGGGNAVSIINNSGSAIAITASIGTLYNTADGATGNRTLAARGMATVMFMYGGTTAYITGAGLT